MLIICFIKHIIFRPRNNYFLATLKFSQLAPTSDTVIFKLGTIICNFAGFIFGISAKGTNVLMTSIHFCFC